LAEDNASEKTDTFALLDLGSEDNGVTVFPGRYNEGFSRVDNSHESDSELLHQLGGVLEEVLLQNACSKSNRSQAMQDGCLETT